MIKKNIINIIMILIFLTIGSYFVINNIEIPKKEVKNEIDSMNIDIEDVCFILYTKEDNKWFNSIQYTTDGKVIGENPSNGYNSKKKCLEESTEDIFLVGNGIFDKIVSIEHRKLEICDNAMFKIISDSDVVNLVLDGNKYTLNKENPELRYKITSKSKIEIDSTNEYGLYYYTRNIHENVKC